MPQNKSKEDLRVENAKLQTRLEHLSRYVYISHATKLMGEVIRATRTVGPWAFIWLSVREAAGKRTDARVDASLSVESSTLTDVLRTLLTEYTATFLFFLLAVAGWVYGNRQATLRKDELEKLHVYKAKYEQLLDSGRSSSKITKRGETRPEDE